MNLFSQSYSIISEFATKVDTISKEVDSQKKQNQQRFEEARQNLLQVKQLVG